MNEIVRQPKVGPELSKPRLDVKKLMKHHLAPFSLLDRFEVDIKMTQSEGLWSEKDYHGKFHVLETLKDDADHHRVYERVTDLIADLPQEARLKDALAIVKKAIEEPPPETTVRLLLGTMLDGFRQKPSEGAPVFVDALVFILEELPPGGGERVYNLPEHTPAAAIAAAAKEAWLTETFPPSIHEFAELCKKYRWRLFADVESPICRLMKKRANLVELAALLKAGLPKPADPVPPMKLDDEIPF